MADSSQMFMSSSSFEQRFNCLICWSPRLRMVYGFCQHRICENCLYDSRGIRRNGLEKCPTCQMASAFPLFKPCIPEDNIAMQGQLGVVKCSNPGCELEMWYWEHENHLSECYFSKMNSDSEQKCKKMKTSPAKSRSHCGYNLRESSRQHYPGKYSRHGACVATTRASKRKMNST